MNSSNYQVSKMSLVGRTLFRTKRNIFDIFTPYSINDLGATANENYKLVNQNFKNVHITEEKLSHASIAQAIYFFE